MNEPDPPVSGVVIVNAAGVEKTQAVWLSPITGATSGAYTVTVAVMVLEHPLMFVAVMVNVVVCVVVVVLVSVPVMLPLPLSAIPVRFVVLSRVQLKVVFVEKLLDVEKTIGVMATPLQRVCVAGVATTSGVGFTTISTVDGADKQPAAVAVTVKVVVWSMLVVLFRMPAGIEVTFDALLAYPVRFAVLFLVQLKVVPETPFGLDSAIAAKAVPLQIFCAPAGVTSTSGRGLTVTDTVPNTVLQPFAIADIVKVVICCVAVLLTSVPEIVAPDPVLPNVPVKFTILSRVQLKAVPATLLVLLMLMFPILSPEQIVWVSGAAASVGFGLTMT